MGLYIYGIISGNSFTEVQLDSQITEKVRIIPHRDIACVVSESEITDYAHSIKDKAARRLILHQLVIEKIMENFTIIPVRLGTFARDENEVRSILTKAYPLAKEIFSKICGKLEIDLACTWSDFGLTLKEVGEEKEIKEIKEKLVSSSKGVTADDQMKVGLMVKKALDRKRKTCAEEIVLTLKDVTEDMRLHELMDSKMLMNAAFLVNETARQEFIKKVEKLNTKFEEKINFRCIEPLPLYSFYTLEIKKINFKEVEWAKKLFGLQNTATREEIKRSHQSLVLAAHPDRNPDVSGKEEEFNKAIEAYKILGDYCLACDQAGCQKVYSFDEKEFEKNAVLIRMRL